MPPILPPRNGYLDLDKDKFHLSFAGDLKPERAEIIANFQMPFRPARRLADES